MQRSTALLTATFATILVAGPCYGQSSAPATNPQLSTVAENEGCKLLPYTGSIPLAKLPYYYHGQPDLRAGIVCHYRIHPDLPLFTFHFLGKPDNMLEGLEITEEPSSTLVQKVEQSTDWGMVSSESELTEHLLTLVDANFDGYEDLQILSNCGATGNCSYDFFLYDPVTHQFVHNEFLSINLCSPDFDAKKKQITTHSNGSAADWQTGTFQYEDGQYTLVRQEISTSDRTAGKVTVNTYELRNGKMELVDSKADQ